jgi:hypothetical protein
MMYGGMGVPDFQTLMLPFLRLAADGQEDALSQVIRHLGQEFLHGGGT